jgi:hypothetical protein
MRKPFETCSGLVNVLSHPLLVFLAELLGSSV